MKPLGVPREQRSLADVVEATEELDDTLETETGTSVSGCTISERLNVVLDSLNGNAL